MGYAELMEKLQSLPSDKQAEVMDFVEFLASRTPVCDEKNTPHALSKWRMHPFVVRDFVPMTRGDANARQ